mmetsp:Transcript_1012/g.1846  ORF Transcript_1012/g.1846 Transcript_1012/m.1846 type:complete len:95 (-) Transcript_1012:430-714(-)
MTHVMQFGVTLFAALQFRGNVWERNMYPLWLTFVILSPLQGFWNAAIYFRPRIVLYWKRTRRHQNQRSRKPPNESSLHNEPDNENVPNPSDPNL